MLQPWNNLITLLLYLVVSELRFICNIDVLNYGYKVIWISTLYKFTSDFCILMYKNVYNDTES